jgi:hypothetical protein
MLTALPSVTLRHLFCRDSSDESGTDEEKEEDAAAAKKKAESIPDWARGPKLKEALERQYGMHGQVTKRALTSHPISSHKCCKCP